MSRTSLVGCKGLSFGVVSSSDYIELKATNDNNVTYQLYATPDGLVYRKYEDGQWTKFWDR